MGQSGLISVKTDWVVIGRIGTAFGVRGWVHVHSFTGAPEDILSYKDWFVRRGPAKAQEEPIAIKLSQAKVHGSGFVAKFVGCDDRDAALSWTNAEIVVERAALPRLPKGEYYWADLLGLTVSNTEGQTLGVIVDFFETGSNDVFVVKGELKEHLIPYIPEDYVVEVDLEAKTMLVNWEEAF